MTGTGQRWFHCRVAEAGKSLLFTVVIPAFFQGSPAQLKSVNVGDAKIAGLMSIVPAFEMPEKEEEQKSRFRDKFLDQLKRAGIKHEPLKVVTTKTTLYKSYKFMNIQCKAKCKFTSVLDLLAKLNENPYLVGVESFKMKCDKSKPQEVELDLTVSTAFLPG